MCDTKGSALEYIQLDHDVVKQLKKIKLERGAKS